RTRLAKIGPGWKRNCRVPPSSTRMFVPVMSAGMRSGVNWIRLNEQSITSAIVLTSIVLPRPGTPSRSAWPLASRQTSVCRTRSRWPTMTRPTSSSIRCARSANSSGVSDGWLAACVVASVVIAGPPSLARVERAEVVADVVLHRQRHIAPVEAGDRVVVEVRVDVLVRDDGAVVRALPLPLPLALALALTLPLPLPARVRAALPAPRSGAATRPRRTGCLALARLALLSGSARVCQLPAGVLELARGARQVAVDLDS